jgi:carbonic anhydrase
MSPSKTLVALLLLAAGAARADEVGAAKNLPPQAALQALKDGNARFLGAKASHCQTEAPVREALATGQAPNAIVLGCSDSRVPPEKVFDQGLGELFTIRVAGNVADAENIASIEYALEHLGPRLIVVMGHESCGAVKTALETPKGGDVGSPSLNTLVAEIQTNLGTQPATPGKTIDKTLRGAVKANVDAVASGLVKSSKILKDKVASGSVKIVRAIYGLSSGKVDFWE